MRCAALTCAALLFTVAVSVRSGSTAEPVEVKISEQKSTQIYERFGNGDGTKYLRHSDAIPFRPASKADAGPEVHLVYGELHVAFTLLPVELAKSDLSFASDDVGVALLSATVSMSETIKQHYIRWTDLVLQDDLGNKYAQVAFKGKPPDNLKLTGNKTRIDGKRLCMDLLFFEKPVAKAKSFTLKLPGKNLEVEKSFEVTFSANDLKQAEATFKKK